MIIQFLIQKSSTDNKLITFSDHDGKILTGFYQLPFSFTLPDEIPSSCEVEDGYVHHFIKATGVRSLFKCNIRETLYISVNNLYDLNQDPFARVRFHIFESYE